MHTAVAAYSLGVLHIWAMESKGNQMATGNQDSATDTVGALNRWNSEFVVDPLACPRDGIELSAVSAASLVWVCPECEMQQAVTEGQIVEALGALELPIPGKGSVVRNGPWRLNLGVPAPSVLGRPRKNLDAFGLSVGVVTAVVLALIVFSIGKLAVVDRALIAAGWGLSLVIGVLGYYATARPVVHGRWILTSIDRVFPGMWVALNPHVLNVGAVEQVTGSKTTDQITITYRDGTTLTRPNDSTIGVFMPDR
ncbi:hypothetical protein [Rhodococcus sp. EPR-134]|uniref:hypothetical protein n=1 Tax=Rhodococcus sp. EPR-134 TaxID=1813675 RepID=UPI0007BC3FE8|nr:hypothetical protein [Rhodococcus sp. EPR-134]KZF17958.1 hypothetical protein A2J01_22365 [Rhodococcus sp. EPR-134]